MKIPQNVLVFLLFFIVNSCDKGPEPVDFDISKIEGTYATSITIQPWWDSGDPTPLTYEGFCLVSLIDSERFIMTFNFGNEFSFPSTTGIIKAKTIGFYNKTGGIYFEIEEADTLKGADRGGVTIITKDGSRTVYGVIEELDPDSREKLWLYLYLRNKQDEFTQYNFWGTKN